MLLFIDYVSMSAQVREFGAIILKLPPLRYAQCSSHMIEDTHSHGQPSS
jgi:hypothetical protein